MKALETQENMFLIGRSSLKNQTKIFMPITDSVPSDKVGHNEVAINVHCLQRKALHIASCK